MNATERRHARTGLWALGLTSLLAMGAASAQVGASDASAGLDTSGNYKQEVQACRSGKTAEDQATCLKEAKSAQVDRKRGALKTTGDLQANALARCDAFKTSEDKEACRGRVIGHATITGSIAGGGLLRQLETTVPAEQTASEPTPPQTMGGPQSAPSDSSSATPSTSSSPAPSSSTSPASESSSSTPPSGPSTAPADTSTTPSMGR